MKYRSILAAAVASLLTAVVVSQAQVPGINSTLASVFTLAYDNSTMKPTYSATSVFVPVANAQDVCSISGSATKTVKVRRVFFGMIATTAVTDPIALLKRSTAYSAGQGGAMAKVAYDSSNSLTPAVANVSTVNLAEAWTANPTAGTLVGVLADIFISVGNLTTGGAQAFAQALVWGDLGSPIVLRGIAQNLAVNFNGGSYPANVASCTFEWTEE